MSEDTGSQERWIVRSHIGSREELNNSCKDVKIPTTNRGMFYLKK